MAPTTDVPDGAFPDGFRWGTATAAHQIEGGNVNNDWWQWEHTAGSGAAESSGDACDSWNRWPEDNALVEQLGFHNYRFSVEWSRIEPAEGEFSRSALDHYRRICSDLLDQGIDPVVTFHHATNPRWLTDRGGWERLDTADVFGRYCERVANALGDVMSRACTINEPNIQVITGYAMGTAPPGETDSAKFGAVSEAFVAGHRRGVEAIRGAAPGVPVGLTLAMVDWIPAEGGEALTDIYRRFTEDTFLDAAEGDDFLGVQAYTCNRVGPNGIIDPDPATLLPVGYEYWPGALEAAVRRGSEYTGGELPMIVTENGIGTDDDDLRITYIHDALAGLLRAMADGVDVRGYTCWSLLDNFEWSSGYGPRFGLVEVDRSTFARTPKPSAAWISSVVASNQLQPVPHRVDIGRG